MRYPSGAGHDMSGSLTTMMHMSLWEDETTGGCECMNEIADCFDRQLAIMPTGPS
jgi:hypothetical protein